MIAANRDLSVAVTSKLYIQLRARWLVDLACRLRIYLKESTDEFNIISLYCH